MKEPFYKYQSLSIFFIPYICIYVHHLHYQITQIFTPGEKYFSLHVFLFVLSL